MDLEYIPEDSWKLLVKSIQDLMKEVRGLKEEVKGLKEEVKGLKEEVKGLKEDITSIKEDITNMKEDITNIKEDITSIKESIDRNSKDTNKRFQTLYQLILLNPLSQRFPETSITSPIILPFNFKDVESKLKRDWSSTLKFLVENESISQEDANCLTLETKNVELNFLILNNKDGKYKIFETTMSSLSCNKKLITKLLQLERQIIAFKLSGKGELDEVGLISPSAIDLDRVNNVVNSFSLFNVMFNLPSYLKLNNFSLIRRD